MNNCDANYQENESNSKLRKDEEVSEKSELEIDHKQA